MCARNIFCAKFENGKEAKHKISEPADIFCEMPPVVVHFSSSSSGAQFTNFENDSYFKNL
jgi:hypothetical protein